MCIRDSSLVDADIVLVIGAWTWQGAQIAKKAKQMDIPYIVCPLGDISERKRIGLSVFSSAQQVSVPLWQVGPSG